MIHRIFWDIDETLIHTSMRDPGQDHFKFSLDDDFAIYHTVVRPCASRLIEFSRELVGEDRVHILTTSIREYAREVNRQARWGFRHENIFSREDLKENTVSIGGVYGSDEITNPHAFANQDNVLIDNLRPRENWRKVSFIGIPSTYHSNYLHVRDYYGVNFPDDSFEEDVKEFLLKRFKEDESQESN